MISGPKLQISLQLDPNKPVSLEVLDKKIDSEPAKLTAEAGQPLPGK